MKDHQKAPLLGVGDVSCKDVQEQEQIQWRSGDHRASQKSWVLPGQTDFAEFGVYKAQNSVAAA